MTTQHYLRDRLAELFPTEEDARRLVDDAQLDAKLIDFDGSAVNFWHSILLEAHKQKKVDVLIEHTVELYPKREAELWQAYHDFEAVAAPVDQSDAPQTHPQEAPLSSPAPEQGSEHIPLVGREQEWLALQQAWQQMTSCGPHLVAVWGEAGVGKTRLVEELLHWARLQAGTVAYTRCYATEGDLGYAPVTTWLRSEGVRKNLADLEDIWLTELARLLPELLTENPNLAPPVPMTEGWQRQRFQEALARGMLATSAPRLFVVEDLQWCDSETLGWLRYLLHNDRQTPLLVVGTVRTEAVDEQHPLHDLRQHLQREGQWTELELDALSAEETEELAGYLTDEDVTGRTMQLYRETEGNPLFVVEMVRAGLLMGQGNGQEDEAVALPQTIQAVITTRLNQLSTPARQLAQTAATIGRSFTLEVLAAASNTTMEMLVGPLDELWQRRIVREYGQDYDFSHAKFREVAYAELTPLHRRVLHRQVAEALAVIYEHDINAVSGVVASHFRQAGLPDKAIPYYLPAAVAARQVCAYEAARDYCNKGLELLKDLPDTPTRMRQALDLLIDLGSILAATHGYAADEVLSTYERARSLSQQIEGTPKLFQVLFGATICHLARAELHVARDLAEDCLRAAQQDVGQRLEALVILGITQFYRGEFEPALEHLEAGTKLYDPVQHRDHVFAYSQDPGVASMSFAAMALWFLGHSDQALEKAQKAYELACKVSHPFSQALALFYISFIYMLRQEWQPAHDHAQATVTLSEQYGFIFWSVMGNMFQSRMKAKLRPASAKKLLMPIEQHSKGYEAMGAKIGLPFWSGMMAETYRDVKQTEKALAEVEQGLQRAESSGDHFYTAELWRLKGELLLDVSGQNADRAEEYFRTSFELAKKQKAKGLQLRTAISLFRLSKTRGKPLEGRKWSIFIRGLMEDVDTPDIKEAKELLDDHMPTRGSISPRRGQKEKPDFDNRVVQRAVPDAV